MWIGPKIIHYKTEENYVFHC